MRFIKISFFLFLISLTTNTIYGQVKNIGIPEIRNYKRVDYKGGTQNWNIDQDKNGNIYFANNNGLFQFDGITWTKYVVPYSTEIKSIKVDKSGKIYTGSWNEFGYFVPNAKGKLEYHSLSDGLKKLKIDVGDNIWKIHIFKNEVIFQSFYSIFVLSNNKIKVIKPPHKLQFSFQLKSKLYFQDIKNGLLEYKNGKLNLLKGTKSLKDKEIWGMFQLPENKILIATIYNGLYIYKDGKIEVWENEANSFIKKNSCLGGAALEYNYFALNSILDGVIVCDINGRIIQHINRKKGLQNNTVLTSFVDAKSNLWLGLDNGITFINENSPFTYLGFSFNISSVYASVIYKDKLYVATNQGLFYHSWGDRFKEDTFSLVEGTTGQAWNIKVINDELICCHNKGLLLINNNKVVKILDGIGYWGFKQIPNKPNIMIGSNYNGFSLFEKKNDGFQLISKIEGFDKSIIEFEIDNNSIWTKTNNYMLQMVLSDDLQSFKTIKKHIKLSKNTNGVESIQKINNIVYFQKDNHFFSYSYEQEDFFENKRLTTLFKNIPQINHLTEDSNGNLWYLFSESLGVMMKDRNSNYKNVVAQFSNLTGNTVRNHLSINYINQKDILIGLTDGIAHYDAEVPNNFVTKPKAYIRSFASLQDTIIFGNNQNESKICKIPYSSNQVKFTFSSPVFENLENVQFSYKLDGFDSKWSLWSTNAIKEYTNLKEGDYLMQLKVRNSYGIQSNTNTVAFTISPPWYRHFLAYLFYFITTVIIIYYIRETVVAKIRKNKYYEKVEQRRLYLEKESKIRQEQFDLEKEIERLKNDKLKIKILVKDKELVNNTLQVVKKNKILNGIIHKLKDIDVNSLDESAKFQFSKLNKSIVKEVNADHSWKDLEKHIKNVHFEFLQRLKEKYPTISPRELDLSTYLLMNMSTKEIAEIMNISRGGVELARYRLRKKLDLNKKENLVGFLMSV